MGFTMEYDPKSSLMTMANNIAHKHRLTDIKRMLMILMMF